MDIAEDFFSVEEVSSGNAGTEKVISNVEDPAEISEGLVDIVDSNLQNCPACGKKTLKVEGGCNTCINEKCGFSKCDI